MGPKKVLERSGVRGPSADGTLEAKCGPPLTRVGCGLAVSNPEYQQMEANQVQSMEANPGYQM